MSRSPYPILSVGNKHDFELKLTHAANHAFGRLVGEAKIEFDQESWKPLPEGADPQPKRHQRTEIPPVQPHTTEWHRHEVACLGCEDSRRP